MKNKILLLIITSCLFFSAHYCSAKTYNITKTADTNDKVCDEDCSLREAVYAIHKKSKSDDIRIMLPAGEYDISVFGELNISPREYDDDLTMQVKIIGAGKNETVINAQGLSRIFNFTDNNFYDFTAVLSNLSLVNGFSDASGGAMRLDEVSSILIDNVIFHNNSSLANGGAFSIECYYGAEIEITNSSFINNSALNGGAIYYSTADDIYSNIKDVVFDNNSADYGGAVYFIDDIDSELYHYGYNDITNALFINNEATYGSAIYSEDAILNINNNTFTENSIAIYNQNSTINIKGTIVSSNGAEENCYDPDDQIVSAGYNIDNKNDCNFTASTDSVDTSAELETDGSLMASSPAIDAIPYNQCYVIYDWEKRIYYRNYYDIDEKLRVDGCDSGAYEYYADPNIAVSSVVGDTNGNITAIYNNGNNNEFNIFPVISDKPVLIKKYQHQPLAVTLGPNGKEVALISLLDGYTFDTKSFSSEARNARKLAVAREDGKKIFIVLGQNNKNIKIVIYGVATDYLDLFGYDYKMIRNKEISLKNSSIKGRQIILRDDDNNLVVKYRINNFKIHKI